MVMPARAAGTVGFLQLCFDYGYGAAARLRRGVQERLPRADRYDAMAAILFGALIVLVAFTFRDYAISNDEEVQQRYAELIVAYYRSGFVDQSVFHFRNLYLYGGLFDLVALGLQDLLPLEPYAVRHLLTALTGIGGIVAVWATARAIGGSRAALLAALAIALCGTWYGAMFNHTKDIPFAAAMMGGVYFLVRIGRELPRPRWHLVIPFGLLIGCALGIRVLGMLLVGYAAFFVFIQAPIFRGKTWRETLVFFAQSALRFLPAFILAYAIMIATWPWAALAPLNPLRAMTAFADFHYQIKTFLDGHVYYMADVPRWYIPTYMAIKLTLPLLVGAALALALVMLPRSQARAENGMWRRETALVALAAFFPLICDVIAGGPAFSGMRHFLFTVPPIAVLAGLGLNGLLARLRARRPLVAAFALAIVLLDFGWNATTLYRLHPEEYLYFNPLVGGLAGASRRYDTDYWVNIMPEAVTNLEHFLDRTEGGAAKTGPRHRYLVAVCGERLPFEKEADARLEWTRDSSRAEFFIAPTHMNCDRALEGKVVASIERMGVVIGVVKDRRAVIHRSVAGLR
ncbi:MAG TPA: glycosyltransferase family 39 protein [Xanthobacteraceae bacterium]|nr:glycosyltransferase family 39 protein [Xanthobacteraceae bacterium]